MLMNRRRLILTSLGALAALPFASQVVENVSAVELEPEWDAARISVASLFVGYSVNTSTPEVRMDEFQGKLRRQAANVESTGHGITTAIGAPIAAVGGAIIRMGSDFEPSLSRVRKP